ncbi:putative ribonuclease H protein [Sesbania bispinosa]|nr:putative ribonuclease H protein [Sesbania bispinosa]
MEDLRGGFGVSLQEGNTHLWNADWLGCGALGSLVDNVHVVDRDKQVKDICIQGQWCFDRLDTTIPLELKDRILSLRPLLEIMNRTFGLGKLRWSLRLTQPRLVMIGFVAILPLFLVLTDWLMFYAKSDHCHLFMATFWWVWRWRNNIALAVDKWNIDRVLFSIHSSAQDFLLFASGKDLCDHFIAHSRTVWTPPSPGVIKVNTNGSFLFDSGVAGLGVVIRSDTSEWLLGVSSAT